ncbi:MAG: hypothetical protein KBG17_07020 [Paludibacteraceae bacterium]|nr:hypothetical protein [Paludibacteraceae bacterium]
MKRFFLIAAEIWFISFFGIVLNAQIVNEKRENIQDSIGRLPAIPVQEEMQTSIDTTQKAVYKPNPSKIVWMGAVVPGWGQILNRKYWKLPIVYGGLLGCYYAYSWNASRYNSYHTAYLDIIDTDPTTNSFLDILPEGYTLESIGGTSRYSTILKTGQDQFRRQRDLSVIVSVAFYALTLVDAFVDAQLYGFDISPDLSLQIKPIYLKNSVDTSGSFGMQCSFKLK